jgi:6-phosphogluconate dehydrogenase
MPMPKGYKKETGYGSAKSLGGMSYHQIANEMNKQNYKMNHSTARNLFVSGLIKIAQDLSAIHDKKLDANQIKKIAIDPRFQEAVAEFMRETEYEISQKINR